MGRWRGEWIGARLHEHPAGARGIALRRDQQHSQRLPGVRWSAVYQRRLSPGTGGFSASPVAAGGRLYLASEDGQVFVVELVEPSSCSPSTT